MVQVIHANWADEKLHLWVEQCPGRQWWSKTSDSDTDDDTLVHPNVVIPDWIQGKPSSIVLRLPMHNDSPMPSTPMSMYGGIETEEITSSGLADVRIPTLAIDAAHVPLLLESLIDRQDALEDFHVGPGVQYFVAASRLAEHLIAGHRFVPMVFQDATGMLTGRWQPWLADDMTTKRVAKLVSSMPAAARAVPDGHAHDAWSISVDFLSHITDASCRRVMMTEEMTDTIDSIDPGMDQQVAWLNGLLGSGIEVPATTGQRAEIARTVRKWIAELEDRGESSTWRFGLRLTEPITEGLALNIDQPDETVMWSMSFFLQSLDDEEVIIRGADVWLINRERIVYEGLTLENPQELLMGELGRASRYYKKLEEALDETEPIQLLVDTQEAYRFLREVKPVLEEQGIAVQCPGWWESQSGRLGTKLRIDSDPSEMVLGEGADAEAAGAQLGLGTLVGYHWEIAIGDTTLTLHEFEELAQKNSPLVRIGGQWVEIRPEDVENAISFMHENPGGEMELGEAMQLALASDSSQTGLPVTGVEATGWVASMLGGEEGVSVELPILETPDTFKGTLRPYQTRGLSWLAFMERFGFGACLADDMGLGKTIQMIALILHERAVNTERPDPTILVVPMSVIGNWVKEFEKFAPSLKIQVHHGVDRPQGDTFIEATDTADVVVTTYALVHRDNEFITKVKWGRVVLDEAQFVKNPAAKQSISVRSLNVHSNSLSDSSSRDTGMNSSARNLTSDDCAPRLPVTLSTASDTATRSRWKSSARWSVHSSFAGSRPTRPWFRISQKSSSPKSGARSPASRPRSTKHASSRCSPMSSTPRASIAAGWFWQRSSNSNKSATIQHRCSKKPTHSSAKLSTQAVQASVSDSSNNSTNSSPKATKHSSSPSSAKWATSSPTCSSMNSAKKSSSSTAAPPKANAKK